MENSSYSNNCSHLPDEVDACAAENQNLFDDWEDDRLNLDNNILRGVYANGFENPSPIQKKTIIPVIKKNDIIAQAQSGTGKTGAFVIGSLQRLDTKNKKVQVIILSPTRELSRQTYNVAKTISHFMDITIQLLIGGTSTDDDKELLSNDTPHMVIGCPGRIYDMIRRKHLRTNEVKLLILDEADEMLSAGFKDQIYKIFQFMNNNVQLGLFSATMPDELNLLTSKFMRNPIKVLEKRELLTLQGIAQFYVALDNDEHKYATLKDLFSTLTISQAIIYCNSIKRVDDLYEAMVHDKFPVAKTHSGMDEEGRRKVYEDFKSGQARVLLSTDLFSRGIDVQQVSIVINFDVPKNIHTYLHRIGRSGRWGRKGAGINFVTRRDMSRVKDIEKYYNTQIDELPSNYTTLLNR
jgi:translation initiation factor 4A